MLFNLKFEKREKINYLILIPCMKNYICAVDLSVF